MPFIVEAIYDHEESACAMKEEYFTGHTGIGDGHAMMTS
jgi:hypothetical protein